LGRRSEASDPVSVPPSDKSVDSPSSYSVVVNKQRPIRPLDYVPTDLVKLNVPYVGARPVLRAAAASEVEALFDSFHKETGLKMQSNSAYRSYADQEREFSSFSSELGESEALDTTARPGYSMHGA
jgi:D-alanyl-D-alanine carboxypeptidase